MLEQEIVLLNRGRVGRLAVGSAAVRACVERGEGCVRRGKSRAGWRIRVHSWKMDAHQDTSP